MGGIFSKEHYELIEMFEKTAISKGFRKDKEPRELWSKGVVYQNGELNRLFLAYREGIAYGIAITQK